ncbi:hypothetical protein LIER_26042 [Lithospermum erythrorhizon]|uniref:Uncharacterized protein n=1 Tax=Lithospermum erythrorhizon TaxID=34254 RepID=A0AAV3R897_LITER
MAPRKPNLYLPWVDVTNVRETENPRPDVEGRDVDVGGDEPYTAIHIEGDDIGEAISPIIERRVGESSQAKATEVADLSEPTATLVVDDSMDKTTKPSNPFING